MARSGPEVADIFRYYGEAYREQHDASLSTAQRRVMTAIELCRTAALGGHVEACDHCGHSRIAFNSCRDRHCPKCQSLARAQWLEDRRAELLDTQYFHVVFTLPGDIAAIAYQNKALVYGLLFRAAAETLRTIAADPKHLGAEIGFFAVLHTWGQNLLHHPHLHCVVAGGGLSSDGNRWIACKPGFFLPVRVLSRLFRRLFLEHLKKAFDASQLQFFSGLQHLSERDAFRRYLAPLRKAEWVVFAKAPFAGPEQVLDYVGRRTHRVAISNNPLIDIEDNAVRFRWKDYRHGNRQKVMTLRPTSSFAASCRTSCPRASIASATTAFLAIVTARKSSPTARDLLGMPVPEPSDDSYEKDYRDPTRISPVIASGNARPVKAAPMDPGHTGIHHERTAPLSPSPHRTSRSARQPSRSREAARRHPPAASVGRARHGPHFAATHIRAASAHTTLAIAASATASPNHTTPVHGHRLD